MTYVYFYDNIFIYNYRIFTMILRPSSHFCYTITNLSWEYISSYNITIYLFFSYFLCEYFISPNIILSSWITSLIALSTTLLLFTKICFSKCLIFNTQLSSLFFIQRSKYFSLHSSCRFNHTLWATNFPLSLFYFTQLKFI